MRASRPSPEPDLKPRTAGRGAKDAAPAPGVSGGLRALPIVRDDVALVAGLRGGEAWARAALFDRYAPHVERILRRVLGNDRHGDMADLVQDAFVQALASLEGLRDAEALLAWMQTIAARTAFRAIRARKARAWLKFWEPMEVPEVVVDGVDPGVLEAHRHTYALLERMPAEERVIFALRYIDGMELERIAEIREVSLATLKRRLARAEQRFAHGAQRDRVLEPWLKEGGRWTT
jgi:RNA polymerase sigma-70 factor (ECF subfamily)